MKNSKNLSLLIAIVIIALHPSVALSVVWTLSSNYHFDDGAELLDSGPAMSSLTKVGTPDEVVGYSGECFGFVSTASTAEGLYSMSYNIKEGIRLDFWFKAGNVQTNSYPSLVNQLGFWQANFQDNTTVTWILNGLEDEYHPGWSLAVIYNNAGYNLWDGQWHHFVASYDPAAGKMTSNIDDGASYMEAAITGGAPVTGPDQQVFIGTNSTSTSSNRGLNGRIDELLIYKQSTTLTMQVSPAGPNTVIPAIGDNDYDFGNRALISADVFVNCPDIYVFDHWEGELDPADPYCDPYSPTTTVLMDQDRTITAVFVPEVPVCGDVCHPSPPEDLSDNCMIDLEDFSRFADAWLECSAPECD